MTSETDPRIFAPWIDDQDATYARLSDAYPPEFDDFHWMLLEGESAADDYPDEMTVELAPDSGVKLADSIPNLLSIYVVSEKLKGILEQTGEAFEFLPLRIRNHKGKVEKETFYIANLLGSLRCMDLEQSDAAQSSMEKDQMRRIRRLVLDPEKIPEAKKIFRLGEMKQLIIVRKDLAVEIYRTQGCRGMIFQDMEEFGEEFR